MFLDWIQNKLTKTKIHYLFQGLDIGYKFVLRELSIVIVLFIYLKSNNKYIIQCCLQKGDEKLFFAFLIFLCFNL